MAPPSVKTIRRPRFRGLGWLVASNLLSLVPFGFLLAAFLAAGGAGSDAGGLAATIAIAYGLPVALATLVAGPFYLAYADRFLKRSFPYFRAPYLIWIVAPAAPFALLLPLNLIIGGPAYPLVHIGMPALLYEVVAIVGGLTFGALASLLDLVGDPRA